jgi:hypothetical protein
MTSVVPFDTSLSIWPGMAKCPWSLCSRSVAIKAIILKVFPRPIGSAIIPPQNCGGSSGW